MKGKISDSLFGVVLENTPLVSIDLIIENKNGQILLGLRNNKPAKDFWFIPGGRIFKDEKLSDAFIRIAENELHIELDISSANFQGVYEHFYEDSFLDDCMTTHYVVLAYKISADIDIYSLPLEQHNIYRWFDLEELVTSVNVHHFTKNYFQRRK